MYGTAHELHQAPSDGSDREFAKRDDASTRVDDDRDSHHRRLSRFYSGVLCCGGFAALSTLLH
jgi:hypothetical protein